MLYISSKFIWYCMLLAGLVSTPYIQVMSEGFVGGFHIIFSRLCISCLDLLCNSSSLAFSADNYCRCHFPTPHLWSHHRAHVVLIHRVQMLVLPSSLSSQDSTSEHLFWFLWGLMLFSYVWEKAFFPSFFFCFLSFCFLPFFTKQLFFRWSAEYEFMDRWMAARWPCEQAVLSQLSFCATQKWQQ